MLPYTRRTDFLQTVKKIYSYGARKGETIQKDGLPRNLRVNIYESLWVGQMTKLPLALKLRYKPL
jgi:hypothetical protein